MNKRMKILVVFLVIFFALAIGHSIFHFYVWGTGIEGFYSDGNPLSIGGLVIGEDDVGEEKTGSFSIGVSLSQMFVIGEWMLVLVFFILSYISGKISFNKEVKFLKSRKENKKSETLTDIDKLYNILKEKKKINFLAIEKAFGVDEEIVKGWAKTLELGGLAMIDYPRVGKPVLVFIENSSENKNNEKKS